MEILIRPCVADDAAALALVGQATFLETYAGMLPLSDILHHCRHEHGEVRYAGWLGRPGYRFWIAEMAVGGAPVAYAMTCPPDLPVQTGPGDVELKRIYALHRFHGSGLGPRLMAAAIEGAQAAGASRLLLGANRDNGRALAFYARRGFVQVGERRFKVGANEYDDVVLARSL
ncbi:GNAT family N-acetyltransferase [Phenylobacterium sp.]|jgi:ribosomal protein S18 acetylase RimI-like enzyme|uniref:GNAT family N-acetyltransferase n=1 Tax=Phenylobacterium sp. TaxID=1871053 RepID=UPI002F9243B2